ncbi:membrane integrity-associated transporter subunit PqiC [candidate division KSB1 bacterium]|nr:membrane integrity-associated transporter subunit PqiC [candidate division KSB1 bacterium]
MKKSIFIVLLLFCAVFIAGCGKKALIRKYYVLETVNVENRKGPVYTDRIPIRVEIRDFQVAKAFDQTRIASRTASNEIDYYFYHHWAVRPTVALADMVYEVMESADLFLKVSREYSVTTEYMITCVIHRLERMDGFPHPKAHLAGRLELIDINMDLPVIQYEFDQQVELKNDRSMNKFAAVLSEILHQETEAFTRLIAAHFEIPEQGTE